MLPPESHELATCISKMHREPVKLNAYLRFPEQMTARETTNTGRRYILNTAFGGMSWILPILISFVATPIILKKLGVVQYGLYATILGFISYSFVFGIGKVLVKYIAEYRASGHIEKISIVVSSTFWLSIAFSMLGALIAAAFATPLVRDVLAIPESEQRIAVVGIYLACGAIVVSMLSQVFQFILQGLHRFGTLLLLANIGGLVLNSGNIALALLGFDMRFLLGWNLISLAAMALTYGVIARKHLPEFSLSLAKARKVPAQLIRYSSSVILYQAIGNILFLFERGIVLREFGAEVASYYLVPMTLGIYLHGATASLLQGTFPLINEMLEEKERLIRLYQKATKLTLTIVVFALLSVAVLGRTFLSLWIDAEFANRSFVFLEIHALTFGLIALWINGWSLAEGLRQPRFAVIVTAIWSLVAIPLMIAAASNESVAGVAISRLLGVAVTVPMIFYFEKRFLGRAVWMFWANCLVKLAIAGAAAVLVQHLVLQFGPFSQVVNFLLAASASSMVFLAGLIVTGFVDAEERAAVFSLFRRVY